MGGKLGKGGQLNQGREIKVRERFPGKGRPLRPGWQTWWGKGVWPGLPYKFGVGWPRFGKEKLGKGKVKEWEDH